MKTLPWLLLASLAALSVAGCATTTPAATYRFAQTSGGPDCRRVAQSGDTMIRIYCRKADSAALSTPESTSDGSECRLLAEPSSTRIKSFCGSTPEWSSFDIWAVDAGVTCRWTGRRGALELRPVFAATAPASNSSPQELCLTVGQWRIFEADRNRDVDYSPWPQNPGRDMPSAGNLYGAGGYGYFPSGGTIGQELSTAQPPQRR